jgi:ActR/RegA family two-component response regulator
MIKDNFAVVDEATHTVIYGGYAETAWAVAVPAAVILIICAFLTKPGKADLLPEGKPEAAEH